MSDADDLNERAEAGQLDAAIRETTKALMGSYEGRWFLAHLMDSANLLQQRYLFDGDVNGAIWRDGRASMAATLLQYIEEHAPDQYGRLIRERRRRLKNDAARAEKRAAEPYDPFKLPK